MIEVFNKITEVIKSHDKVIIMAHRHIDYDALGSALGLYEIVKSFNKDCGIYVDSDIKEILNAKLFDLIADMDINFIYRNTYNKFCDSNTLLIIVDTHKEEMLANKEIVKHVKNTIIIDHHIKSNEYIKDVLFSYIDSNLSSINEFVAFYLKYLNKKIDPVIATIMLTGIELDTNDFHSKTTPNTFMAASFLTSIGADTYTTLELMKEDKELTIRRNNYLSKSYLYKPGIMICPLDEHLVTIKDLAIISDMQLRLTDIELGFVIGYLNKKKVGISARSNGKYDVSKMMEFFNGGGHATEAAAQIEGKTIVEVEELLKDLLKR